MIGNCIINNGLDIFTKRDLPKGEDIENLRKLFSEKDNVDLVEYTRDNPDYTKFVDKLIAWREEKHYLENFIKEYLPYDKKSKEKISQIVGKLQHGGSLLELEKEIVNILSKNNYKSLRIGMKKNRSDSGGRPIEEYRGLKLLDLADCYKYLDGVKTEKSEDKTISYFETLLEAKHFEKAEEAIHLVQSGENRLKIQKKFDEQRKSFDDQEGKHKKDISTQFKKIADGKIR